MRRSQRRRGLTLELAVRRVARGARLRLVAAASASAAATAADADGADRRVPLAGVGLRARQADGAPRTVGAPTGSKGWVACGSSGRCRGRCAAAGSGSCGAASRVVGGRMDAVAVGPRGARARAAASTRVAGGRLGVPAVGRVRLGLAVRGGRLVRDALGVPVVGLGCPRLAVRGRSRLVGRAARDPARRGSGSGSAAAWLPRPGPVVLDRPRRGHVRVVLAGRVPLERRGRVGRVRGRASSSGASGTAGLRARRGGARARGARPRARRRCARADRSRLPNNGAISARRLRGVADEPVVEQHRGGARVLARARVGRARGDRGREALVVQLDRHGDARRRGGRRTRASRASGRCRRR